MDGPGPCYLHPGLTAFPSSTLNRCAERGTLSKLCALRAAPSPSFSGQGTFQGPCPRCAAGRASPSISSRDRAERWGGGFPIPGHPDRMPWAGHH